MVLVDIYMVVYGMYICGCVYVYIYGCIYVYVYMVYQEIYVWYLWILRKPLIVFQER